MVKATSAKAGWNMEVKENAIYRCPVQPSAPAQHGFFGVPYFKAHVMMDERWDPTCLTKQYKAITDVVEKYHVYKKHEKSANKKRNLRFVRSLKKQCHDGRIKLQMALHTNNAKRIRNILMDNKDMQRLYNAMPIHLVMENVVQKTFVMRKERDRLRHRLEQLIQEYQVKLIEQSEIENRIKYQNEFVLDEELEIKKIRSQIECANVRLYANKTLNEAYKKVINLLKNDEIYYEPILSSLQKDIDNQTQFIKFIIQVGLPTLSEVEIISGNYRKFENRVRRNIKAKSKLVQNFQKKAQKQQADLRQIQAKQGEPVKYGERYVRETSSMVKLKEQLEQLEAVIKQVKSATLCSEATEVYPRIKKQLEDNQRLNSMLEGDKIVHDLTVKKLERSDVMRGIVEHNLTKDEVERLRKIGEHENAIAAALKFELKTSAALRERGEIIVLLRFALWNFNDILRHVAPALPQLKREYPPNSDLEIPLVNYDDLGRPPPSGFEEKIDALLKLLRKRIGHVMAAYKQINKEEEYYLEKEYHETFVNTIDYDDFSDKESDEEAIDDNQERKFHQNILTRKQLKQISAKMVEEFSKKDD